MKLNPYLNLKCIEYSINEKHKSYISIIPKFIRQKGLSKKCKTNFNNALMLAFNNTILHMHIWIRLSKKNPMISSIFKKRNKFISLICLYCLDKFTKCFSTWVLKVIKVNKASYLVVNNTIQV